MCKQSALPSINTEPDKKAIFIAAFQQKCQNPQN